MNHKKLPLHLLNTANPMDSPLTTLSIEYKPRTTGNNMMNLIFIWTTGNLLGPVYVEVEDSRLGRLPHYNLDTHLDHGKSLRACLCVGG